jgi:hypothetical protein
VHNGASPVFIKQVGGPSPKSGGPHFDRRTWDETRGRPVRELAESSGLPTCSRDVTFRTESYGGRTLACPRRLGSSGHVSLTRNPGIGSPSALWAAGLRRCHTITRDMTPFPHRRRALAVMEVKGRFAGADMKTITRDEILTGFNTDRWILVLAEGRVGRGYRGALPAPPVPRSARPPRVHRDQPHVPLAELWKAAHPLS